MGMHSLWTDTQIIGAGLPATIRGYSDTATHMELYFHTHGDQNRLFYMSLAEPRRWTADVVNGVATFELSADEVQVGRFTLVAAGGIGRAGLLPSPRAVHFQAIDSHTALRHGTTRDNIGGSGEATMVGFTSRINPDTIRAYQRNAGGEEIALVLTRHQAGTHWLMPYGVRFNGIAGSGDERANILRGLQFEALPGFTFELSLQENLHMGGQPPASWAASPAAQLVGPYPHWRPSGTGARPTDQPLNPINNRGTNFDIGLTYTLTENTLTIDFSAPVNPRDFGIGFDFSEDFSLEWNDESTRLVVTFDDIPKDEIERIYGIRDLNMYIIRVRAADGTLPMDVINTPIRVQFSSAAR